MKKNQNTIRAQRGQGPSDSNNYIKTYSNDDDELMMLWEV